MRLPMNKNASNEEESIQQHTKIIMDIENGESISQSKNSDSELESNNAAAENNNESPSLLGSGCNRNPQRIKIVLICLIVLIGAAAASAFVTLGLVGAFHETKSSFEHRAKDLTYSIDSAFHDYQIFGLWTHESCFKPNHRNVNISLWQDPAQHLGFCSREDFSRLYAYIQSVGVEVQAIEFIPNITNNARAAVEAESRKYYSEYYPTINYTGFTRVAVNATPGSRTAPEADLPFYFPVHYVEPVLPNSAAIDLNLYTNPARKEGIDKAIETWQPTLTDRLKLVQETDPNAYGLGLFHPGARVGDLVKPEAFSLMIIRIPALLERAARIALVNTQVYIFESKPNTTDPPVFLGAAHIQVSKEVANPIVTSLPEMDFATLQATKSSLVYQTQLRIADRFWTIVVQPDDTESNVSYIIVGGVIILVVCLLLAYGFNSHMVRVANFNRIRTEAEAEKSKNAIVQAKMERELNEFIAHEVRNPLSSAIAALSFVSASANDVEQETTRSSLLNDLRIVDASLQFINELLRNMLDLHRAADRQLKLTFSPVDVLRDVLDPVASILFMRGANVQIQTECPTNLMVLTDRMRLKQIILNLSANSTKFVEHGFIRLRADVVDGTVQLYVEDSGPGIPPGKRDRLFAKFQESLDLLNQGTGIGLCVCKNLSEIMGAEIRLDESFVSGVKTSPGTRFVVDLNQPPLDVEVSEELPREREGCVDEARSVRKLENSSGPPWKKPSGNGPSAPDHVDLPELPKSLKVLFVDDDTVLRKMFCRSLGRIAPSWDVQEACNGETALRLVEEGQTYDLIFVDQYMASIEKQLLGTETVLAMRSKGIASIICGLSANDTEQQFLHAGADSFMIKPFPCEKISLSMEIDRVLKSGRWHRGANA